MRIRSVLAILCSALLGAAAMFGVFYVRELKRYNAYKRHMLAYDSREFAPSLFDPAELCKLRLTDSSGAETRIQQSSDRVMVISFWAEWCKPCTDEFDSFVRLRERFGDRVDFFFLTDDAASVRSTSTRYHLPFYSYSSDKLLPDYFKGPELPRTYIIRDGRVLFEHRGGAVWDGPKAVALFDKLAQAPG